MAGRPGAAVLLEVATGKLLASFHLQTAAQRLERPGSTVKPLVLLELLESGKIKAEQRFSCHRRLQVGSERMDCAHSAAITDLDATEAIAYSCNSYFAAAAKLLSPAELADAFRRSGFTSTTGLTPAEATGELVLAPDTPRLQLQALGSWGITITPLELLWSYRNLALRRLKGDPGVAAPVFSGLEASVHYGMAHAADAAGITVAGKTGTAAGAGSLYAHGFFAGYAPAERPEIALMIYLEHGRGSDAAAIAGAILTSYAHAVTTERKKQ